MHKQDSWCVVNISSKFNPPMGIYMPKVNSRNTRKCEKVWNQFKPVDFEQVNMQLVNILPTITLFKNSIEKRNINGQHN